MKPAPFDYARPETIEEALTTLAETGDEGRVLAGGQSLIAMLNMRLARPAVLIDVMHIDFLMGIEVHEGSLRIGAAVRQHELLSRPGIAARAPLLAKALPWVGHAQTRARGTVCGSIAHADPSAELPLCLALMEGTVHLCSAAGRREIKARDFFTGMMTTALQPDEMIEAVSFPLTEGAASFHEVGRRHGDFAIVAAAALRTRQGVRIAIGGVDDVPRVQELPADVDMNDALNDLAWSMDARSDLHASAAYRRKLVRELGARAVREVMA